MKCPRTAVSPTNTPFPLTLTTSHMSSTAGAIWGKLMDAKFVFLPMKGVIFLPDVVFNTLLDDFAAPRKMEDGHGLLKEMQQKGCEPHAVLYTALIQALCSRERMD
ncbi:unnamed protein product [Musa acuminata subsp. malaccensis]|uniref:(wild Malaysian banana) hypothetical protein n=1 Tax=Musa acuminata subsp. malaccensis TaxID=214687 RepID=A0A804HRH2_MUSAM|nr:unnamed protein product [Musa acuminata subsp. malaccensis]